MEERYYNVRQAANQLGIKVRTVRQWITDKKLKAHKYGISNRWFISESEIRRIKNGEPSKCD